MRKKKSYKYEKLVIGSDFVSLLYAAQNHLPIIWVNGHIPFEYERFKYLYLPFPENERTIKSNKGQISWGSKKSKAYACLAYSLSLDGLMPFSTYCENIIINESESKLTIVVDSFNYQVEYEELIIVNEIQSESFLLNSDVKENDYIAVQDWFWFKSYIYDHDFDVLFNDELFVSEIWFYDSQRNPRAKKDFVVLSKIPKNEKFDFDYSDTSVRFILKDLFYESGILPEPDKKPLYPFYRLESPLDDITYLPESNNIKHIKMSEEEINCEDLKIWLGVSQFTTLKKVLDFNGMIVSYQSE